MQIFPKRLNLAKLHLLPDFLPQHANIFTRIYSSNSWHFATLILLGPQITWKWTMHTDKLTTKCHICLHTWKQGGLMCGIWDWQSTIVKDLNDSQDPKHTLICRENAFVAIYALFSDNKCPLFTRLGGGGRPKRTLSAFFYRFSHRKASLSLIILSTNYQFFAALSTNYRPIIK